MRNTLAICAAISIVRDSGLNSPHVERTAEHCKRRSAGIPVEREHLLIERHQLWSWLIRRPTNRICSAQGKLLQNVILKCRSWNGRGGNDRQCNPDPLAVEEKE